MSLHRLRELVEDLWLQLQIDHEKRQWALYAVLGVLSLVSMLPSRRAEERRAQALGKAIGRALRDEGTRS